MLIGEWLRLGIHAHTWNWTGWSHCLGFPQQCRCPSCSSCGTCMYLINLLNSLTFDRGSLIEKMGKPFSFTVYLHILCKWRCDYRESWSVFWHTQQNDLVSMCRYQKLGLGISALTTLYFTMMLVAWFLFIRSSRLMATGFSFIGVPFTSIILTFIFLFKLVDWI